MASWLGVLLFGLLAIHSDGITHPFPCRFVGGEYCIGLFAEEDIPAGTELTYDYRFQPLMPGSMKECLCGSTKCRGFLGNNKKREEIKEEEPKDSKRA